MNFVNLTPHEINNVLGGKFPPSGGVARVSSSEEEVSPGFFFQVTGEVDGLPGPVEGVLYIVSAMVRMAVADRPDVVSPGSLVRGENGQPIGCKGFSVNLGFVTF